MTSRNLQIFVTVAELGKMTEAARVLYITQSSVSQAIASIEQEYGVVLFERLSRGIFLTDAGKELLNYARGYFSVKSDMEEFLLSQGERQALKIGATITVGTCVISPLLLKLKAENKQLNAQVLVENTHGLEGKLLKNEIDVALVEGKITNPELVTRHAIEDRMVLICPNGHRFSGREEVMAAELGDDPFILREKGSGTRTQFETEMANKHLPISVSWTCCNTEAIKNAVADGHGVSVVSERLVLEDAAAGRFFICRISDLDLDRYFDVVYHKDKYISRPMQDFIDACMAFGES
ncbi:MAG TPA: LysR family transcriptional regulator [Candidatus Scatomorpha gallistercoris]|nr:LysR family transcriptional regulator [Candidatus Scatomorpha gallistercoris]